MTANSQIETMVPGNVKLAMKDNGATSSDLWMVPVANLKMIEGFNVRQNTAEYRAHLTSITDMILENGFRKDKPLTGYVANEGGVQSVYITDGHTRLAGAIAAIARGASIEELPVVLVPKGTNKEDLTVGLVVSNTGKPLSPFEVGLVCKRLVDYGWEEKTIAKRLGFSGKYVNDLLSLLSAPKAVRDLVIAGRVSATLAIEELATNPFMRCHSLELVETLRRVHGLNPISPVDILSAVRTLKDHF